MHRVCGAAIESLLPAPCPSCERPLPGINRAGLCPACWSSIRRVVSPLCPRCGIPSAGRYSGGAFPEAPVAGVLRPSAPVAGVLPSGDLLEDRTCGRCLGRAPAFDGARCALLFEGAVRTLLHLFKFDDRRDLAGPLSRALLDALPPDEAFDLVIPVPLHWTRRLVRGYNQAALLARRIARARGVPWARGILVKRRRTADQSRMDAKARRRNVRACFAVRRSWRDAIGRAFAMRAKPRNGSRSPRDAATPSHHPRSRRTDRSRPLDGRRILLVDDILTTGATAEACARVLKAAGAARVFVVAVARTPLTGSGTGPGARFWP